MSVLFLSVCLSASLAIFLWLSLYDCTSLSFCLPLSSFLSLFHLCNSLYSLTSFSLSYSLYFFLSSTLFLFLSFSFSCTFGLWCHNNYVRYQLVCLLRNLSHCLYLFAPQNLDKSNFVIFWKMNNLVILLLCLVLFGNKITQKK